MSLPDIDWTPDYAQGYNDAIISLLSRFEKEYYETAAQDPYYGYYVKYVMDTIRKQLRTNDTDN